MNRFFAILAMVVSTLTGCAMNTIDPDGSRHSYVCVQVCVHLRVVNNCAPSLQIEKIEGPVVRDLKFGEAITVPVPARPWEGRYQQPVVTVKAYTASGQYIGSATKRFSLSANRGSHQDIWEVDRLQSPRGAKCPGP